MKKLFRNVLVGFGAYYLALWVAPTVNMFFAPVTNRLVFDGDFEYAIVMPLVLQLPMMLVAAGVGAITAWLADGPSHWRWAILPAALFLTFGLVGDHWIIRPQLIDLVAWVARAVLPAVACLGGALALDKRVSAQAV